MIAAGNGAYLGLLSFLSFAFSVIAAVMAIDMYTLLRTGHFGKTWRVLIIASVMFALMQAVRMAEFFDLAFADYGLSQIVELMFVVALAYAFFLQRKAFSGTRALRGQAALREHQEADEDRAATAAATAAETVSSAAAPNTDAAPDDISEDSLSLPVSRRVHRDFEHDPDIEWHPDPAVEMRSPAAPAAPSGAPPR